MNELINTEIWSTGLYLSLQVYFEDERLPILSSWLNSQAQDNMNKVYQMMNRICHDGGCVAINEMKRDTHEWTNCHKNSAMVSFCLVFLAGTFSIKRVAGL